MHCDIAQANHTLETVVQLRLDPDGTGQQAWLSDLQVVNNIGFVREGSVLQLSWLFMQAVSGWRDWLQRNGFAACTSAIKKLHCATERPC